MALDTKDLEAIRLLMREEIRDDPFKDKVDKRFDEVFRNFDAWFLSDEKREQEYLVIRGQLTRLEQKVDKHLENVEKRIEVLEKKVA